MLNLKYINRCDGFSPNGSGTGGGGTDNVQDGTVNGQLPVWNNTTGEYEAKSKTDAGIEPAIAAGTTAQYWKGNKSWSDLATDVFALALTGLTTLTGTILPADTIYSAFRKIKNYLDTVIAATLGEITTGTDNVKYITPKGLSDYAQEWATTDTDIITAITGATYEPANNNIATITPANSKVFKFSQIYVGGGHLYYALANNTVLLVGKRNILKRYTAVANGTNTVIIAHGLPDITSTTPFIPYALQTPAIQSVTIDAANITIIHTGTIADTTNVAYNIAINLP